MAIAVADENAIRIENLDAEVALELAEESEHTIDRAAGRFAAFIDSDGEEAVLDQRARRGHGSPVSLPSIEKRIDLLQQFAALRLVERGRDSEQPGAGSGRKRFDFNSGHGLVD